MDTEHVRSGAALDGRPHYRHNRGDKASGGRRRGCRACPPVQPVPPSPDTSAALLEAFAERGIEFVSGRRVASLERGAALLDDGSELPYDLFPGGTEAFEDEAHKRV